MLGTAGEAAYHRGDLDTAERLARAGLERATDGPASGTAWLPLSVVALARGAYAEAVEHALAAAERGSASSENLGHRRPRHAYSGDLDGRGP